MGKEILLFLISRKFEEDKQEFTQKLIKIGGCHNIWYLQEKKSLNVLFNYLGGEWEKLEAGICRGLVAQASSDSGIHLDFPARPVGPGCSPVLCPSLSLALLGTLVVSVKPQLLV